MVKIEVLNGPVYQWDTGRKVKVVGENVTEIHFSSVYSENAYVTEPTEGIVSIPSVLLQSGTDILVYVVSANEDGEQTIARKTVYVNKRSKPDDYIYTEDEVFTFKQLEERVTYLEEHGSTGGGTAVDAAPEIYIGSGEMPDGYKLQIDPSGEATGIVEDVMVSGVSIVNEGVADIPIAKGGVPGLMCVDSYPNQGGLYRANGQTGLIRIQRATETVVDERTSKYEPIVPSNLDYAVKAAMTDGKGAEWTTEEKASARERMGINLVPMLDAPLVIEEDLVGAMNIELPIPCQQVIVLVKQPQDTTAITLYNGIFFEGQQGTGAGNLLGTVTTVAGKYTSFDVRILYNGIIECISNINSTVNSGKSVINEYQNYVGKKLAKVGLSSISATLPKGTEVMILGR